MTDQEMIALKMLWASIAPHEPNNWEWSCRWQVWEQEHGFLPQGFLQPESEDDESKIVQWRQAQNERYDRFHQV